MKPFIPLKTSPFALWFHVRKSHHFRSTALAKAPLYLFILAMLDNGAQLTNTKKRPIIVTPENIDLKAIRPPKMFNFTAKKKYTELLSKLPPGLNS